MRNSNGGDKKELRQFGKERDHFGEEVFMSFTKAFYVAVRRAASAKRLLLCGGEKGGLGEATPLLVGGKEGGFGEAASLMWR